MKGIFPTDNATLLVLLTNLAGWGLMLWRNSMTYYQHKAMWREYAKRHDIPNGGH